MTQLDIQFRGDRPAVTSERVRDSAAGVIDQQRQRPNCRRTRQLIPPYGDRHAHVRSARILFIQTDFDTETFFDGID
ncbi:hypothetical protein FZI85_16500 [Mycobacterium sp. CBMA293]|nr:hypothetical protein [Mycolicibacterium sp. CBMA 293]